MATDNIKNYPQYTEFQDSDRVKIHSKKNKLAPVSISLGELKDQIVADAVTNVGYTAPTYVEIDITSAQILDLLANPITVLPALSVNQYYTGEIYFEYTFVTTGYVGGATTAITPKSGTVIASSNTFRPSLYMTDIITGGIFTTQKEGDPLKLTVTANSTTGDGTLKVKIWYTIKTFG